MMKSLRSLSCAGAEVDRARRDTMRVFAASVAAPALLFAPAARVAARPAKPLERTGGPFVPTPWPVVDEMIRTGSIVPSDLVMDLGCGDGRLVIAAAQRHGARGYGVDIDPDLVRLANANAQKAGVSDRVRFEQRDIFDTDVSEATVLTLYLLPAMMMKLRPRLQADLRPGARIVSHDYHFGNWRADSQLSFDVPEKLEITGVPSATVYLWVVPARIDGRWQLSAPGAPAFDRAGLVLQQSFQDFEGTLRAPGRAAQRLGATSLRGVDMRFALPVEAARGKVGRAIFRGRIEGERIEGAIESSVAAGARFTATRLG